MTKSECQSYIASTFGGVEEYPFANDPATCVFRHPGNRKWFAVLMQIPKAKLGLGEEGQISILNVKCDQRMIGSFRLEEGIYPAYHMNKSHWLTVVLNGTVAEEKLKFLLAMSYELTKGKRK